MYTTPELASDQPQGRELAMLGLLPAASHPCTVWRTMSCEMMNHVLRNATDAHQAESHHGAAPGCLCVMWVLRLGESQGVPEGSWGSQGLGAAEL